MDYEIVTVEQKYVEGVEIKTENADGKAMKDIGGLWTDFLETGKGELIRGRVGENFIGLYTDYEGDFTKPYAYVAGCETDGREAPTFVMKKIEAGKYAKFSAKGDLNKEVDEIWNAVWALPMKRKYASDFEEYIGCDGKTGEIHIYIGIE